jgi:hypothetical protein
MTAFASTCHPAPPCTLPPTNVFSRLHAPT